MKAKEQIFKFIQRAYAEASAPGDAEKRENYKKNDSRNQIQELFDGMSTGTARIIIEKEVSQQISEAFDINPLENKGRYCVAKIVRPNGGSIQRLLIDKQTGSVQMVV